MSMGLSSDSSSCASPAALDWKFSQVFGDKLPGEDVQDIDIISAIEFDKNGSHLAVGDRGGRVVIFESKGGKDDLLEFTSRNELERLDSVVSKHPRFQYKTEFQSHEPEFDYLKSIEIEEKINKVRWCAAPNGSLFILSTNDKTIKLWKVKDRDVKRTNQMDSSQSVSSENALLAEKSFINGQNQYSASGHSLQWTEKMGNGVSSYNGGNNSMFLEDSTLARCRRVYAHAHDFNVNSISVNSDCETFLSGDDLRINLWNLEVSNQCFNIIDMKPANMEDLLEVITAAEFHPSHCNLLAYSSSRGFIRIVDMRQSALCDHNARILKDEESHGPKSFFTEIIASITDLKFANDGRHILSRDYMNLKLCDLYNNDAIFDKFECCLAKDRLNFATGSYRKPHVQTTSRPRRSSLSNLARGFYRQGNNHHSARSNDFSYDFNSKLLHMAWHPTTNLIACAAGNSLLMYYA
ncbi:UNVERIFIED_CONTAM: Serine/threonine protein phosphatase 2A regulatory subunit B beta isoform [Sesamum calycinum]|uniref:Serine/threonine-protein phosphatase 2A 55 kDa regulatory subunit B n=1 Tax=Sesamum calycinum TaxID=2727403 RepID=A0AAW2NF44_9LAMI